MLPPFFYSDTSVVVTERLSSILQSARKRLPAVAVLSGLHFKFAAREADALPQGYAAPLTTLFMYSICGARTCARVSCTAHCCRDIALENSL